MRSLFLESQPLLYSAFDTYSEIYAGMGGDVCGLSINYTVHGFCLIVYEFQPQVARPRIPDYSTGCLRNMGIDICIGLTSSAVPLLINHEIEDINGENHG
jgi:hypothetical protein